MTFTSIPASVASSSASGHPGALALGLLQQAQRLRVDARAPGDTMTVFHPPLDITPVERVIRWFFSVPQWVQLTGIAIVAVLAITAIVVLVWQRHMILSWLRLRHETTPVGWKVAGAVAAVAVLVLIGTAQVSFFVYSQHENQFCISCHTLHDEVYQRFQQSRHHTVARLECHDCHAEPLIAEVRQVGLWILKRPEEVGPHAPVPRTVCARCHIQEDADSSWQRIIATAGHSVHVLSDTAKALDIECLTCHGVTAHRFVPVSETCAQSGCHDDLEIRLGRMAGQTGLHCVVCHEFTAPIRNASEVETARLALVPKHGDCLRCHAMRELMSEFVPANDPHEGECGACHNPHRQTEPSQAFESCASGGCHARADTLSAFHRGISSAALAQCGSCHQAHTWKVKGSVCLDCHRGVLRN